MCPFNWRRPAPMRRPWIAALLLLIAPAFGWAADPKPSDTSLDKVPADVEAHSSTLRLGETIQAVAKSRAWKMIWGDPAVQEMLKKAQESLEGGDEWPFIKKFLEDPANKDLTSLGLDALSQEIFVSMGSGWGDLIALGQDVYGGAQYGPLIQQLKGGNGADVEREQIRMILKALAVKPERLRIHDLVFGFKVSDPAKVTAQLKRLDPLLADALKETPLKGRSERSKIGEDEFLTLKVDGSMIPWAMIPVGMIEDKEGEFAPLIAHVKKMKLQVSLGVRQGYLLLALGESSETITRFGGEGPKLASQPEFKVLEKAAGKPLTAIGYTSAKLRQALATKAEDITGMTDLVKTALNGVDLPKEQVKALEKDIDAFAKELARNVKKPGTAVGFSYRTPRGWETFEYNYGDAKVPESRPLTLLNHLGGNPLMASVWRSGTTVEDFQFFVKWVGIFGKHLETIAAPKIPNGEEIVKKFHEEYLPLLKELSDITEKSWLPALTDGQEGFVLDAKWSSKSWQMFLPAANAALPLPELGIVLGVSDSAKLEKALEGYRGVANKLLNKARGEIPPGAIPPDFEIPKPKVESDQGNTFAYYPIPPEIGIDKQFQPTGGLSKKVAVLTLSRGHSERLLNQIPLRTDSALLADIERPLDSIYFVNWAGIVDIGSQWLPYMKQLGAIPDEAEESAHKVLTVLKVFRGYTSVTYREKAATVTHSEAVFKDIEPDKK